MKTVYSVDAENLFTQYSWILENYDVRQVLDDFIEKEKASLQDVEFDYDILYKRILGKEVTIENITEEDLNLLNYVLKYQKGIYKKGEIILETDEPGTNTIDILEPGYYQIELSGASGNHGSGEWFNYINPRSKSGDSIFKTQDGIKLAFDGEGNLAWVILLEKEAVYGRCEMNKDAIFFFLDDDFLSNSHISRDDHNESYFLQIAKSHKINHNNLYDYAIMDFDPLSSVDSFGKITFVYNGFSFQKDDSFYKKVSCLNGITTITNADKLCSNQIPTGYYRNIINENLQMNTLKTYSFRDVLTEKVENNQLLFKNSSHGGDAACISIILKITDDDVGTWNYKIGKQSGKGQLPSGNSYIFNKQNTKFIVAEGGGNVEGENGNFVFEELDKNLSFLKNISLESNPNTKNNFKDISSKDFVSKLNFHTGEQPFNDPSLNWKDGVGRALLVEKSGVVFSCEGGGSKGTGLRLNTYENSYWESGENGKIKITFLGALQCKKNKIEIFLQDQDVLTNTFIENNDVPAGTSLSLLLHTNHYLDGIDFDDSFSKEESGISPDVYNSKLKGLFTRDLNFFKTVLTSTTKDRTLSLKTSYRDRFLVEKTENDAVIKCDLPSAINGHNKSFTIGMDENGEQTYVKFKNTDYDYDKKLLSLYNNFYGSSIVINNSAYDAVSGIDILEIDNSFHFLLIQNLKHACQLQLTPKNKLDLPQIKDSTGSTTHYYEHDRTVNKIEYCLNKPTSESDLQPYIIGSKLNCSDGMEIYFKISFNSSRIIIDEDLSTFPPNTVFYEKDFNIISCKNEDNPPNNGYSFQWIKITAPGSSQTINIFVKRECYTLSVLPDLYSEFLPTVVNSKKEYEVLEEAQIIIPIKSFYKLSTHNKVYGTGLENNRSYVLRDTEHTYESFFKFSQLENKSFEFNICECNALNKIFSSSFLQGGGSCTLNTNSSRNTIFGGLSQLRCLFYDISIEDVYKTYDENVSVFFKFKKNDITVRFTADYLPFKNLVNADNGDSFSFALLKPYSLVVAASGGPSGKGGDGGNGMTSRGDGASYTTYPGGNGGDGFVGGAGGTGGDAPGWRPQPRMWAFLPIGIALASGFGSSFGVGGIGFSSPGADGNAGAPSLGSRIRGPATNVYASLIYNQEKRISTAYVGAMFKTLVTFKNNSNDLTCAKAMISGRAGRQGCNGIDGGTSKANFGMSGTGGGGGTVSFLKASGKFKVIINTWGLFNHLIRNDCTGWTSLLGKQDYNGFIVFGGLPGNARTWSENKKTSGLSEWWGWSLNDWSPPNDDDLFILHHLDSGYVTGGAHVDFARDNYTPYFYDPNRQFNLINTSRGAYTCGCTIDGDDEFFAPVSPRLVNDHPEEQKLCRVIKGEQNLMRLMNVPGLYNEGSRTEQRVLISDSWATKSASSFSTGCVIIFTGCNVHSFAGSETVISFHDNVSLSGIVNSYNRAINSNAKAIFSKIQVDSWGLYNL